LEDIDMPTVGDDDVLVRVRAASVNPLDWHFMRGAPYLVRLVAGLSRPRAGAGRLGADMAGSVEAVGTNVTEFKPGDEVSGGPGDPGRVRQHRPRRRGGREAGWPDVRAGGVGPGGGVHGLAGAARQGPGPARA
jgi:NADPH:quinone reductase-like Zn-dependent oxidoreductase